MFLLSIPIYIAIFVFVYLYCQPHHLVLGQHGGTPSLEFRFGAVAGAYIYNTKIEYVSYLYQSVSLYISLSICTVNLIISCLDNMEARQALKPISEQLQVKCIMPHIHTHVVYA